jgi:hypothetical protein
MSSSIRVSSPPASSRIESPEWRCRWRIDKFDGDSPLESVEGEGNLLMTNGANALWTALTGGSITAFSNANATIGVGDSTTAENASQTDLQASTNKLRKALNAGYPQVSTNQVTFQATFGSSDANFAWNEFAVFNASSSGTMLNRKVSSIGTKASGSTWVFSITITLS